MNIILFSKIFYPSERIGAVRPSNFAHYWATMGHDITVVCEAEKGQDKYGIDGVNILYVSNSKLISNIITRNNLRVLEKRKAQEKNDLSPTVNGVYNVGFFGKIKSYLGKIISELFEVIIEYDWHREAVKQLRSNPCKKKFDIGFSSFGPLGSFLSGMQAKKTGLVKRWICDYRDNMTSSSYSYFLNLLFRSYEKSALRLADKIVFVSKGQRRMFLAKHIRNTLAEQKCYTIYNGYKEATPSTATFQRDDCILRLAYTGQLYSGKSNFAMLFDVIEELIELKTVDPTKIIFTYAGHHPDEFHQQVCKFSNVKTISRNQGFVSKRDSESIQHESDILVALAWNTTEEQGILSGKFLEYLQKKKPIIALTSGNLANGELSEMVADMRLGIACEYFSYEKDKVELKQFVLDQYLLKRKGESLIYDPDIEKILTFNYKNVSNSMLELITSPEV